VSLTKWRIPDHRHIADLAKRSPYRILDIITRFSSSRIEILFLFPTQIPFILHRDNLLISANELDADVLRRVRHASKGKPEARKRTSINFVAFLRLVASGTTSDFDSFPPVLLSVTETPFRISNNCRHNEKETTDTS
jgi:hypothetical protein